MSELELKNERDDMKNAGEVTVEEARQILSRFIASHFNKHGEHARFTIPADPRRDDDLRLSAFIGWAAALEREVAELRTALEAANNGLKYWEGIRDDNAALKEQLKTALWERDSARDEMVNNDEFNAQNVEEFTAKTPRTADGVMAMSGMPVYIPLSRGRVKREVVGVVTKDGGAYSAYRGSIFPTGNMDMSRCYSTKEAAEAAKKGCVE